MCRTFINNLSKMSFRESVKDIFRIRTVYEIHADYNNPLRDGKPYYIIEKNSYSNVIHIGSYSTIEEARDGIQKLKAEQSMDMGCIEKHY